MTHPTNFPLITDNDTPENLERIRKEIRDRNFTADDVKIIRSGGLLQVRTKREI